MWRSCGTAILVEHASNVRPRYTGSQGKNRIVRLKPNDFIASEILGHAVLKHGSPRIKLYVRDGWLISHVL